ncbi:MAG: prenyltransferase/squalene oxidase repeat-containing protein, partial [Planctomycetota bacterium]
MKRVLAAGLAFLILPVAAVSQDPPQKKEEPLHKKIDAAIKKGVKWLKGRQKSEGHWGDAKDNPNYKGAPDTYHNLPGIAAFSLLALVKSDVSPKDSCVRKGLNWLFEYVAEDKTIQNYERAAILMLIEACCEAEQKKKDKRKKKKKKPGVFEEPKYRVSGPTKEAAAKVLKVIIESQTEKGGWRYGPKFNVVGSPEDVSATHFVLLGMKSASRLGLTVRDTVYKKAMDYLLSMQEKDGPEVEVPPEQSYVPGDRKTYAARKGDRARGWRYIEEGQSSGETAVSGSMTCAGVGSLLVIKSALGRKLNKKRLEEIDRAIWDGFAWLYRVWTVKSNPGVTKRYYYYLYGLERIGTLGMYEKIGPHWWYGEGAAVLV